MPPNTTSADPALCRVCRIAPPPFRRAVAYGPYQGRMRELIHALKYNGLRPAARELGRRVAFAIARLAADAPQDLLVVPVPLHRVKHLDRGFNQALLLATEAVRALRATNLAWHLTLTLDPGLLVRVRPTESQAGLTPRQRRLNMRRAFAVADPARVAGRNILLIDDILTTGATARAASRALVDAGAASVWVVTLARAQRNSIESFGAFASTHNTLPDAVPGINSQVMHESHHQPSF